MQNVLFRKNNDVLRNQQRKGAFTVRRASNIRTHLKIHSGEMQNKCNRCEFTPIKAGNLKINVKTPQCHIAARFPFNTFLLGFVWKIHDFWQRFERAHWIPQRHIALGREGPRTIWHPDKKAELMSDIKSWDYDFAEGQSKSCYT